MRVRGGGDKAGEQGRGQYVEHLECHVKKMAIYIPYMPFLQLSQVFTFFSLVVISSPVTCANKHHQSRKLSRLEFGQFQDPFWVLNH